MQIGTVVKSIAGRDKNRFYIVLELDDNYAYIVDGKVHKLNKPKRKNLKHLSKTNSVLSLAEHSTNNSIRRTLSKYNICDGNFVT